MVTTPNNKHSTVIRAIIASHMQMISHYTFCVYKGVLYVFTRTFT